MERPHKRLRRLKACRSCRQMKKKCDGEEPCSYCSRFNHVCQYEAQQDVNTHASPVTPNSGRNEQARHAIESPTGLIDQRNAMRLENTILDPETHRYIDSSSAIAFPRLLGIKLGAVKAPRLHSFAWNLGLRSEQRTTLRDITDLISLDDVHVYTNEFFTFINPVFEMLDETEFRRRVSRRWRSNPAEDRGFDAVVCGVVALGCFCLYKSDNNIETTLATLAKDILQDAGLIKPPELDLTAAWVLRAVYLRMTSRPHASWMATSIVMHLIESSGIHHEVSSVGMVYPPATDALLDETRASYRRRIFWVGRALHNVFSYEYSRPKISLDNHTNDHIDSGVSSTTKGLLHLAEILPKNTQSCKEEADITETKALIRSIANAAYTGVPLSLFAADLAFAAYRHIRSSSLPPVATPTLIISHLLSIGTAALHAIKENVLDRSSNTQSDSTPVVAPWWCLVSTPFHYILVLIFIDTPESLAAIPFALQVLQEIARLYDSHMTREAVQNAAMLIRLSWSRKEEDTQMLRQALDQYSIQTRTRVQESTVPGQSNLAIAGQLQNSTAVSMRSDQNANNPNAGGHDVLLNGPQNSQNNAFDLSFANLGEEDQDVSWEELCQYLDWN